MALFGLRNAIKRKVSEFMGEDAQTAATPPPRAPAPAPAAPEPVVEAVAPPQPVERTAEPEAKVAPEPPAKPEAPAKMDPTDDTVGPMITREEVQELLDDMVRPALQGDGGDITLIKVENNDIHVKLVGACSTCPSSIMTMKMGVEALLREEFPHMGELVQHDA